MEHIPPIPTNYRGVTFRSKLEATWAVFLDHSLDIKCWQYEPGKLQIQPGVNRYYYPDFRLDLTGASVHGRNIILEVKPLEPNADYLAMLNTVAHFNRVRLLLGVGTFFQSEPDVYELPANKYAPASDLSHSILSSPYALRLAQSFRFDLAPPSYEPPRR